MTMAMAAWMMLCTLVVRGQATDNGIPWCKIYCSVVCIVDPDLESCITCKESCKPSTGNPSPALTNCRIGCLISTCSRIDSEGYEGKRCVKDAASCAEDCRMSYARDPASSPA